MHEVWDRSVCYVEKMERRTELMRLLGNRYYAFAYSSLPIIGSFLLAKAVMRKDRVALMGFGAVSIVLVWLDVAMIMKAPLILYIGVVGLTLALSGFGILRSILLAGVIAFGTYFGLSMLQFCVQQPKSWNVTIPNSPSQILVSGPAPNTSAASTAPSTSIAVSASTSISRAKAPTTPSAPVSIADAAPSEDSNPEKSLSYKAWYMARAVVFRMSAAFPYYVQTFSDPDQRCGIELPPTQLLPRQSCFGPNVIFQKMYPRIQYLTGFAPTGAILSAYGEAGPLYSAVVVILGGVLLGVLAFFANGNSPFSVSLCVAGCVFAYYLTQASFTGSIIDGYGLLWLLLPLILMKAMSSRANVVVSRFSDELVGVPATNISEMADREKGRV